MRRQVNICSAHSAIPALGSPLSNRCCRCAGIVLQNGCQVANWVTDVCGERITHGTLRKYQGSEQDVCVCVFWWTLSGLASIKEAVFCNTDLVHLPCRFCPPLYSVRRRRLIRGSGTDHTVHLCFLFMDLGPNSCYFPIYHELTGIHNLKGRYLLHGTSWIFKYNWR